MGIARVVSLKRRSSVPVFGCRTNQSTSSLKDSLSSNASTSAEPTTDQVTLDSSTASTASSSSLSSQFTEPTKPVDKEDNVEKDVQRTWVQKGADRLFRWIGKLIGEYPLSILIVSYLDELASGILKIL